MNFPGGPVVQLRTSNAKGAGPINPWSYVPRSPKVKINK